MRGPRPETPSVRTVADTHTLKALADPLRLALLTALMRGGRGDLRIMSVKELATEINEPQTKLYRHMQELEVAGLIRVAESRMVSGVLEQRYQACQTDLKFARGLLNEPETADDTAVILGTLFEAYRERVFAVYRADQVAATDYPPEESYRKPMLSFTELSVSPARAVELRQRLQQVVDELAEPVAYEHGSVAINTMIAFYANPGPASGG